jgi:hypothetical protein
MKKILALAISVAFIGSFLSAPAFGAAKAGATCTKAGLTSIASGKKYTCTKSGKKLVWDNGVLVANSASQTNTKLSDLPKNPSSPTPKPMPTTSDTASVSTPIKSQTPLQKLNSLIYQRYLTTSDAPAANINFIICPHVSKEMAASTMSSYSRALKFWTPLFVSKNPINWVLMGDEDYSCWRENVAKLEGKYSDIKVWDPNSNVLGHCSVNANAFCGYGTGVRPNGVFVQYTMIGSNYKIDPDPQVVNHEAVHLYQMSLESDHVTTRSLQGNPQNIQGFPNWFIEGQANLFGQAIALKGSPEQYRNQEIGRLQSIYPNARTMTKAQWSEVLSKIDSDPAFTMNNRLGYSIGWFALEYMYENFTIEQMHAVLVAYDEGASWSEAITSTLGRNWSDLNDSIAEYLATGL